MYKVSFYIDVNGKSEIFDLLEKLKISKSKDANKSDGDNYCNKSDGL